MGKFYVPSTTTNLDNRVGSVQGSSATGKPTAEEVKILEICRTRSQQILPDGTLRVASDINPCTLSVKSVPEFSATVSECAD